ncbi:unnamed protein product, partial [Prorocentrum cordatum]
MYTCQSRSARPPGGLLGRKSVGLTRTSAGYSAIPKLLGYHAISELQQPLQVKSGLTMVDRREWRL